MTMVEQGYSGDSAAFKRLHRLPLRTTVETAFLGNNVHSVETLAEAYERAAASPGTVVLTGMDVERPEEQGLPSGAKALLFNDGAVVGRCAAARRIVGHHGVVVPELCGIVREAVFAARHRQFFSATTVVGLDGDFMVKARLMISEGYENNLYSWMLNFKHFDGDTAERYKASRLIDGEGEILVFADPEWSHPDFPLGLAFFSPEQNCAAVLGMRYFGELKKGTLTLGWGTAARHGYASCHGGLKRYRRNDGSTFVLAVFGLSGSGKSTITHASHDGKYDISVLHDDAFVVNVHDRYAIAMEPTYFDKMQDYPTEHPANRYLLTLQNCGAAVGSDGLVRVVAEDLRNGNGRAIKSRFWTKNRVDRIDEPLNAICWIMKDPTLPPVLKVTGSALASTMGATLATKRTSAERLAAGVDPNALVIESYANPFRTWPLGLDYELYKTLFDDGVDCYILNTGDFMGRDIPARVTLQSLEHIVDGSATWSSFGGLPGLEVLDIPEFPQLFDDAAYRLTLSDRLNDRKKFIFAREHDDDGIDRLPQEALNSLRSLLEPLSIMR